MPDALFDIAPRIRRAVLNILQDAAVRRTDLVWELGKKRGFSNLGELVDYVDERYDGDAAEHLVRRLHEMLSSSTAEHIVASLMQRSRGLDEVADEALAVIPDDLFVMAVELGEDMAETRSFEPGGVIDFRESFEQAVTELFTSNGVPYHFDEDLLVPSLSPSVSAASVHPAVDALDDPRLADARRHFLEATRRLQEPDPDEAVDEARQAIEAAMVGVLDAHGVARPARHQANELFNALVPKVMSSDAQELVLGVVRFRGRTRAGHAGQPAVTLDEAQAAVASAAGSLLFLIGKLPGATSPSG